MSGKTSNPSELRDKLDSLIACFHDKKATRFQMEEGIQAILEWKQANNIPGLWDPPLVMVTATLDDAMGHGLDLIHQYAEAVGLELVKLGLLQSPDHIIQACHDKNARVLGLTVLQQFSDEDAVRIGRSIPENTLFIAGGAAFLFDPDLAEEARVDYVAKDALAFLQYLLKSLK
ncbi:hypothetical protein Dalk_3290 [Desulfatibacillum aliphaticivorans]|uniref:B12-binding domain-containing protein n=1 Tax=Desulfatibacillum aliphaticivorans TaxID=218208 RepID=B8FJ53_DESAL|nr:cobalamin B12-binding domain-containing protein [Desulfatibacillum aliphaticivorans]ACL04980.1 hypothetical protein Dalk_3290 [Desulfatibacillum aliphaticivorans]